MTQNIPKSEAWRRGIPSFRERKSKSPMMICKICNINESQYKCPKCTIEYCSLTCFKDQRHSRCTEKFYQEQVNESLKAEKVSELSDEREKMMEILKKLKNLGDLDDSETEDELVLDDLEDLNLLNSLSVQELEGILGEEHLKNINSLIINGINEEWLKNAELMDLKCPQTPWFTKYTPSSIVLNEELPEYIPVKDFDPTSIPDLKTLTKKVPSDFLWNNLLELTVIYSFVYTQFSSKELEDDEIIDIEVIPILIEMCSTLLPSKKQIFTSAVEAVESAKSAIFFNSTDHDMNEILSHVMILLKNSKILLIMLAEIIKWFNTSESSKTRKSDEFLAQKKLEFMLSWLNSEIKESNKSVHEILKTLSNIVTSLMNKEDF